LTGVGLAPEGLYRGRRDRFAGEARALGARSGRLANLRLLVFVVALAVGGWGIWSELPWLVVVGVLLLGGFVVLVVRHRRVERVRRRLLGLARINDEADRRIARDWATLPVRHVIRPDAEHPYALDLDLFGRASLFHLLESIGTRMGETALARRLLSAADPASIRERQAAVVELAPMVDLRDELTWRGLATDEERPDPEPFLAWAESPPWLRDRAGLVWAARISPLLLAALFVPWLAGLIAEPLWIAPLLVNLGLAVTLVGRANATIARVSDLSGAFRAYADALELITTTPFEAPALRRLQATLGSDRESAHAQIRRLHRATLLAQPTSSMIYPVIELATLWNVHALWGLERWQVAVGHHARGWLEALGEVEALAALARLAHDNPDWAFPDVDPSATRLAARDLGHPLLPGDARVVNDVEVGPAGTFLLVTGSNMSGKSTLLRAIGVNVALGQAGGPVCASELRMPPVALWTSMRVSDSLERGVSYFMAELQRLKHVVDAALAARDDRLILYLLDEILQGTNTAERQVAARRIIRLLLSRPAIGAVSTHDLTLADAEDLAAASHAVHFTETVSNGAGGPAMTFDYKLRPGIARSSNALRLMELVGLP
jgi:hypothetical protein